MLPVQARTLLDKIIQDAEAGERAPFRALARPRLRPYLPGKTALKTLAAGLLVLTQRLASVLGKALRAAFREAPQKPPAKEEKAAAEAKEKTPSPKKTPVADWLEQAAVGLLCLLVAGVIAVTVVAAAGPHLLPYLPIITSGGLLALLIAAWVVAPEPAPKKDAREARDGPAGLPPDTPEGRRFAFLCWLEKTTRGEAGIHLDQMHRQLTQLEPAQAFPRHYLRPLLEHYGIPVQRTLRVGPVSGRTGVSRQAIEVLLAEAAVTPPPEVGSDLVDPAVHVG